MSDMMDRWWHANEFEVWLGLFLAGSIFLALGVWYGWKKLRGTWDE